jgi:hypothetical protein
LTPQDHAVLDHKPLKILLGTYQYGAPAETIRFWNELSQCPIEVYEDVSCVRRYVIGEFWYPQNATSFFQYLVASGIPSARLIIFHYPFICMDGWDQWTDFGERIE